ncbi:cation-translocating P-type ATPase [Paenibacillus glycanilyticus]|uniref:heavy metal translocating P-type ATPase n=1 Tax=Paenibacillus glycanilyticus TaxID=126569 RepID=UPI002041E83A|nr:cation-translocating P-type ATPase [Paenibacillus glycanilyticus]MCM3625855.1 cation-translocating P-type ATPase [Paenibacillus glycanilyticus]
MDDKGITIDLSVQGMSCTACAARIEKNVGKMPGVEAVAVSYSARTAWVQYMPGMIQPSAIMEQIGKLGFKADLPENAKEGFDKERSRLRLRLMISLLLTLPLLSAMVQHLAPFAQIELPAMLTNPWLQLGLATIIQFVIGLPFYIGAYHAIRSRATNMDVLVATGTSAAYLYSHFLVFNADRDALYAHEVPLYFETSAVVITAVLLGKFIEASVTSRAQQDASGYSKLLNTIVRVERAGVEMEIKTEFVRENDYVIVQAGQIIPVDGTITSGESEVDESLLTGESVPLAKRSGDSVWAGTQNGSNTLRIRTTAAGYATMLSRIVDLVRQAQRSKSVIQRQVDTVSAWFVPAMLLLSLGTFVIWVTIADPGNWTMAFRCAVAVVLAACPCALGLATPISLVVASRHLAKRGIVVKEAGALERLAQLNMLVLDKTGTLTEGKPKVSSIHTTQGSKQGLLRLAAAVESSSTHPLAIAIRAEALQAGLVPPAATEFTYLTGKGVEASVEQRRMGIGNAGFAAAKHWSFDSPTVHGFAEERQKQGETVLYVADNNRVIGAISFLDAVKPFAKSAVSRLRKAGVTVLVATGDHPAPALSAAQTAGITPTQVFANMLPEDKLELVDRLKRQDYKVGMAGDGWNDAPALAAADVGLAMGDGTDAALTAGHITLLQPRMTAIPEALLISRLTVRNVRQNLTFAFIYNAFIIPFAACGMLQPWMAGTAMAFSSVSVVGNAIRLGARLRKVAGQF